jgi:hypothetical protein
MPDPDVETAVRDAFMLGWEIIELKCRVQIALVEPIHSGLYLSSVWRAGFNRIAALQNMAFPHCATAHSLYEPPPRESLPYLYPPEPDYANVGVIGTDINGDAILDNFKLYEVTRRAINCLTLLYIREDESLIPDVVTQHQDHLVGAILTATQNPGGGGGVVVAPSGTASPQDDRQRAKEALTERTVRFLDAWDGYLRENYYVGGMIPNNDIELIAYEAGHSMCSLSWGVSSATMALEQTVAAAIAHPETQNPGELAAAEQALIAAWKRMFRDQDVIRLQHQISALSSTLDDAYYLRHRELTRPDDNAVLVVQNPDLPSQAILAVKHSIDYWQRAIIWVAANTDKRRLPPDMPSIPGAWSKPMRLALTEQSNLWQTLMTGQQSLRSYNMESVTRQLMQDVTVEIQESLQTDFKEGIHQAEQVMKEVANEAKGAIETIGQFAAESMETIFQSFVRLLWPVMGCIALVFIVLLVAALISPQNGMAAAASGGVGITGIITAITGYLGLGIAGAKKADQKTALLAAKDKAKTGVDASAATAGATAADTGNGNFLTQIEGAAEGAGQVVLQALERGYEQMRIELDGLNRSVAVTYPLVEFVVTHFIMASDAAFLTDVIWSGSERAEEIRQVLRAAFGPLAILIPGAKSAAS